MRPLPGSLWRHADFVQLWVGETVSSIGSAVSRLAVPLTASILLQASPLQMGVLGACQAVPFLLLGLVAGVWVDRRRRRPTMIVANVGRALLLATIPLAAVAGVLSFEQLLAVSVAVGTLTVFFDVAYGAFLPCVVRREQLAEGNAKLALSAELARVTGPGLAGLLVQLITAPLAILVDALSFVVSAVALARIRATELPPASPAGRRGVWPEVVEGLRVVRAHPILRPLIGSSCLGNIGDGLLVGSGIFLLFATRELAIEPAVFGAVMSGVGIGGLAGAALVGPLTRRFGLGSALLGSRALWAASYLSLALVAGSPAVAAALFAAALAVVGMVNPIAGAHGMTLMQSSIPMQLQGRATAIWRVAMWGGVTLGALAGGALGETVGLRPAVALAGLLPLLGFVWLAFSPVRSLREVPALPTA